MTPVVYLHGFASGPTSRKARYFRELLGRDGFHVEIPDLAEGRFAELTITGQLDVVFRACRGEPVVLIGSSLGGYLAALYAARHPEVEKVVLLAPAFSFAAHWAETLGEEKLAGWRETGRMPVFHHADSATRELGWHFMRDARQYEDAPAFRQPALIFHGAADDVVPVAFSQRFADTHDNVSLRVLASGHQLTDVLETMGAEILRFLEAPGPPAVPP
jgi:pimeloyl-ACP methyl ester carboxylesterase